MAEGEALRFARWLIAALYCAATDPGIRAKLSNMLFKFLGSLDCVSRLLPITHSSWEVYLFYKGLQKIRK